MAAKPINNNIEQYQPLSKYPIGSIRELWTLSYPLMLSALSGTLMIFLDRMILARFNTEAMNAAAAAGMVFYAFLFGAVSIAGIAEVFVGQHNGARRYHLIGQPVWAMLWFSAFLIIPMLLLGYWGSNLMVPASLGHYGVPYLKWLLYLLPSFAMTAALSAFFIGRGEVNIVTWSVALGNLLNLGLDLVLVFGVPGWLEPQGTQGAAIATGVSQLIIGLLLLGVFLRTKYRKIYGTTQWQLDWDTFTNCFRIGLPNSIGHLTSILAWAVVLRFLADVSFEHITVFSIGQSIWILFSFISDGSQKAISAVASNLIGAGKTHRVSEVVKSGFALQGIYALGLIIPLVLFPGVMVDRFLPDNLTGDNLLHLKAMTEQSCYWMWIAFVFDALAWVIAGVLTAAGDTLFIMVASAISSWFFGMLPMAFFILYLGTGPTSTLMLIAVFTIMNAACFYLRFRSNIWASKTLISQPA